MGSSSVASVGITAFCYPILADDSRSLPAVVFSNVYLVKQFLVVSPVNS